MLSINTPSFSDPSRYQLSDLPAPVLSKPTDVIIKVHAASVNPIDLKLASGLLKLAITYEFPFKIGYDCAGVVTEVGGKVAKFKVGDEVYVRLPEESRGSWSEYAVCDEQFVALKPTSLSFEDAASLPLAAMTAMQALSKYRGSLSGKTVFVPAGLSGTGAYACQLAKNVFHAGKVITTVSTAKVDKVPTLLGQGVVDQVIDYTKQNPNEVIPPGSVDFILDTTGQAMLFLSLMTPSTSLIISISTQPSGSQLQESSMMRRPENPQIPWYAYYFLNLGDAVRRLRARRWKVEYRYLFLDSNGNDLEGLARFADEGKLVPVVGSRVDIRDIENVKDACGMVYRGKGGVGKTVIQVIKS